jgi:beta-barrel assembly-enhancing protease
MSPYTPTEFDDSVNVSRENPLKEALRLVAGIAAVIVAVHVFIALLIHFALPYIPVSFENYLWKDISPSYVAGEEADIYAEKQAYLQKLLDAIPNSSKPEGYDFKIHLIEEEEMNAYALPGGHIVVTSALLEKIPDENALVFVLGHELGHFENRDHLRGIGMGIAGMLVSILLTGDPGSIQSLVSGLSSLTGIAYSKHQESSADLWGLKVLHEKYGHVGGATSFFELLEKEENNPMILELMSTHPVTENRIAALDAAILAHGYEKKPTNVLPWKKSE